MLIRHAILAQLGRVPHPCGHAIRLFEVTLFRLSKVKIVCQL